MKPFGSTPEVRRLAQAMRFHLRPLGVGQYKAVHPKLESQSRLQWNPESQQTRARCVQVESPGRIVPCETSTVSARIPL